MLSQTSGEARGLSSNPKQCLLWRRQTENFSVLLLPFRLLFSAGFLRDRPCVFQESGKDLKGVYEQIMGLSPPTPFL